MLNKNDYTYNGIKSIIHNINSSIKIFGLFIYTLICLLKFNNTLFICNISLVFMLLLLSNISLSKYIKIVWKLKYIIVLFYVILLRFNMEVKDINIVMFQVIFLILYIAMIVYTTTKDDIVDSFSYIVDRINILGFNINIVSSFLDSLIVCKDYFIDSYNDIIIDMELKGTDYVNNNIISKVKILFKNIKLFFCDVCDKIKNRKKNMYYRMYDKSKIKIYRYKSKLSIYDYIYVLLFLVLIIYYVVEVR